VVDDAVAGLQLQQCITAGLSTIDRTHAVIVQQKTACLKCMFSYVLRCFQQFPVVSSSLPNVSVSVSATR
jgi:hypothetical protein